MGSALILHAGASTASLAEVQAVVTPESTDSHVPIPHGEFVGLVKDRVSGLGFEVVREEYGLWREGLRLFGVLELGATDPTRGYSLMIGLRNSHDKSISAILGLGSRVFVCDNLAFHAEVTLARKHTARIRWDLPNKIEVALGQLTAGRVKMDQRIDAYHALPLDDKTVHDVLIRTIDANVLPVSKLPAVLGEWREPQHEEFAPRTAWSLFNAYTEVFKTTSALELPRRTIALQGVLDRLAGLGFEPTQDLARVA